MNWNTFFGIAVLLFIVIITYLIIDDLNDTKEFIEFCKSKGYDGMKFGNSLYDGNECVNKTEGEKIMDEFDEWKVRNSEGEGNEKDY